MHQCVYIYIYMIHVVRIIYYYYCCPYTVAHITYYYIYRYEDVCVPALFVVINAENNILYYSVIINIILLCREKIARARRSLIVYINGCSEHRSRRGAPSFFLRLIGLLTQYQYCVRRVVSDSGGRHADN